MSVPSQGLDLTFRDIAPALVELLAQRRTIIEDWEALPAEERLDDHLQAQFQQQLAFSDEAVSAYLKAEVRKVDGCASVLLWLESQEAIAKAEEARLYNRRKRAELEREYLERSIMWAMESAGKREVVGQRHTLKLKRNPPAVEVAQPDLVPLSMKRFTLTLNPGQWESFDSILDELQRLGMMGVDREILGPAISAAKSEPSKPDIKAALKDRQGVPGCRMVQKDRLVIE